MTLTIGPTKRFLAFSFEKYYPRGGKNDFVGSFESLEEATASPTEYGGLDVLDTGTSQWFQFEWKDDKWIPWRG